MPSSGCHLTDFEAQSGDHRSLFVRRIVRDRRQLAEFRRCLVNVTGRKVSTDCVYTICNGGSGHGGTLGWGVTKGRQTSDPEAVILA